MGLDVITLAAAKNYTDEKVANSGGNGGAGTGLPPVTAANNGNFLRVIDGKWAAASLPIAEDSDF